MPSSLYTPHDTFHNALIENADDTDTIYLISVDFGYIDMAMNLYETSFKKLHIRNFLYVCSDQKAVQVLHVKGIPCYLYKQTEISGGSASGYLEGDFAKKTHIKTKIVLSALLLGFTVILSDVDIVYISDPANYFYCDFCDVEMQNDYGEANSGFYIAHPKQGTILLHQLALANAMASPDDYTSQQMTMNAAVALLEGEGRLTINMLDPLLFPCGYYYYEVGQRMYATDNPCNTCIIVHNNWIVTKAAKIYRFKENLQWQLDDDQYYSDPTRKYLVYENTLDFDIKTVDYELAALRNALFIGYLLNRTVILPTFSCTTCLYQACEGPSGRCALNTHLQISVFDKHFSLNYREHVFLSHPKVPKSVKTSISPTLHIKTDIIKTFYGPSIESGAIQSPNILFSSHTPNQGVQPTEILQWFKKNTTLNNVSVLKFHTLYAVFQWPPNKYSSSYSRFVRKLNTGFVRSNYRQYDTTPLIVRLWNFVSTLLPSPDIL